MILIFNGTTLLRRFIHTETTQITEPLDCIHTTCITLGVSFRIWREGPSGVPIGLAYVFPSVPRMLHYHGHTVLIVYTFIAKYNRVCTQRRRRRRYKITFGISI